MPDTKYFCTMGYAMMIGIVEITAVAIFTVSKGISWAGMFWAAREFFS